MKERNHLRTSCSTAVGRRDFYKQRTEDGAVQPITATQPVVRKAERQDSEMDNELMINTFLTLIPKNTIATQLHIHAKR